jgi:hypothetical protein
MNVLECGGVIGWLVPALLIIGIIIGWICGYWLGSKKGEVKKE